MDLRGLAEQHCVEQHIWPGVELRLQVALPCSCVQMEGASPAEGV